MSKAGVTENCFKNIAKRNRLENDWLTRNGLLLELLCNVYSLTVRDLKCRAT